MLPEKNGEDMEGCKLDITAHFCTKTHQGERDKDEGERKIERGSEIEGDRETGRERKREREKDRD